MWWTRGEGGGGKKIFKFAKPAAKIPDMKAVAKSCLFNGAAAKLGQVRRDQTEKTTAPHTREQLSHDMTKPAK